MNFVLHVAYYLPSYDHALKEQRQNLASNAGESLENMLAQRKRDVCTCATGPSSRFKSTVASSKRPCFWTVTVNSTVGSFSSARAGMSTARRGVLARTTTSLVARRRHGDPSARTQLHSKDSAESAQEEGEDGGHTSGSCDADPSSSVLASERDTVRDPPAMEATSGENPSVKTREDVDGSPLSSRPS